MNIQALFPQGRLVLQEPVGMDRIGLPLRLGEWLELRRSDLSDREWALAQAFLSERNQADSFTEVTQPWQQFLEGAPGAVVPEEVGALEFIWLSTAEASDGQWLNLLRQAMPNLLATFRPQAGLWVLVLDQTQPLDVRGDISEMLPALEFDLATKIKVGLGQIWPVSFIEEWPALFAAEQQVFVTAQTGQVWGMSLSLGEALQKNWAAGVQVDMVLLACLKRMLVDADQMESTVEAMWEEAAVVTKAAQRLFVHRNTLQNRLEKFRDQTGLNLKTLDDLLLCRLALLH